MKRIGIFLLALFLLTGSAVGCGNSEQSAKTADTIAESKSNSDLSNAATTGTDDLFDEITEITVKFVNPGGNVKDGNRIIDAVNQISEAQIGVHVNAQWIDIGSWNEQMNLAFSASEPMDIISISPTMNLNNMVQANQMMDISELLNEFGTETLTSVHKLIPATTYGDAIYGLPKLINMYSTYGITMNQEMLEEAGLMEQAETMSSWSEFEKLLLAVKEAYPQVTPLFCSNESLVTPALPQYDLSADSFSENKVINQLGDPNYLIYVDPETNTVYNIYETEFYETMLERIDGWYKKGLVYKDAPVTVEDFSAVLNSGAAFSYCSAGEGTAEDRLATSQALVPNYKLFYKVICEGEPSTSAVTMFGYGVPFTAKEPEAAVKFLNLMYTNADVQNLLTWGEEGVDYVVDNGIAKYPEDKDPSDIGYHSQAFNYGNSYISLPWEGKEADYNKQCQAYYESMGEIAYLGCTIDTSDITIEVSACQNDILEFRPTLISGSAENLNQTFSEFNKRLKEHGVDVIIQTYQEQLNEWLSSK